MTEQARIIMTDPWGARARDWAEVEDEGSRALFEEVLDLTKVGSGSRYLDVGCGSGLACAIARARGAEVSGIDSSRGLLAMALERTPDADLREGDMASLPWDDDAFDAVTFINTFFFAADQEATLREAARVTTSHGRVAVTTWTSPERCESVAYLQALTPLLPPMPADVGPFIGPDRLRELATAAGLHSAEVVDVDWTWDYHSDLRTALRGLLSPGLSTVAIAAVGEDAVKAAITEALEPFRTPGGGYRLQNRLHCLLASA
jgi:SAM-dependent methyltransferase